MLKFSVGKPSGPMPADLVEALRPAPIRQTKKQIKACKIYFGPLAGKGKRPHP